MYKKFHIIGAVYSNDLPKAMNLKEAKAFIRTFTGLKRITVNNVELY